ncbi:hypothetical protein F5146DRAFT_1003287 [Armillaria mellea]|nr:hypothetical protein F5146DRAFT_1003287 [Armillaria mellea]
MVVRDTDTVALRGIPSEREHFSVYEMGGRHRPCSDMVVLDGGWIAWRHVLVVPGMAYEPEKVKVVMIELWGTLRLRVAATGESSSKRSTCADLSDSTEYAGQMYLVKDISGREREESKRGEWGGFDVSQETLSEGSQKSPEGRTRTKPGHPPRTFIRTREGNSLASSSIAAFRKLIALGKTAFVENRRWSRRGIYFGKLLERKTTYSFHVSRTLCPIHAINISVPLPSLTLLTSGSLSHTILEDEIRWEAVVVVVVGDGGGGG